MSKELKAKRSQLITEQKKIVDSATKETRGFSAEEKEKLSGLKSQIDSLTETIVSAEGVDAAYADDNAIATRAVSRKDTAEEVASEVSERDFSKYSILKVIRSFAENRPLDGIEREISDEIAKRSNQNPRGIFVPTRIIARRALDTTAGVGALQTIVDSNYIDLLRAQCVTGKVGATFMGGLVGTFGLPRQNAGSNTYWLTEGNSPTAGAPTLEQVVLSPKTVGAYVDITRAFVKQSSIDAENFVKQDLLKNIAIAIDKAAINGSGSAGQPTGILNNSSCPTVALTSNTLTYAKLVSLETTVAAANVSVDSGAYVTTPSVVGTLKTLPKVGTTMPIFSVENGQCNGYPIYGTNVMPSTLTSTHHGMIFGNWADLIIGQWGALDLLVDPYSLSSSGGLRVVALQTCDVELRHPESFAKVIDITP